MTPEPQPAELRPPPAPPSGAGPARARFARVGAPELARRAQMERTRGRLVVAACGFALLFGAVGAKLGLATLLDPARRAELRERGLARAARFSWDACAEAMEAVYREARGA